MLNGAIEPSAKASEAAPGRTAKAANERKAASAFGARETGTLMLIGWSILLMIHGIMAVFLLGAITHQAVGVAWLETKKGRMVVSAVRGVNGTNYTNVVAILFVVRCALGTLLYPTYRANVRTVLQEYRDFKP